ncbi:interleukin-17F [Latimeria chalumnae]|nr:PREDICTED: interleukin-17A [Latimeria chalumnae]|eukprot:XP_014352141.1 PREDICTED: interleukin-17A [Latimeria chalumnae]
MKVNREANPHGIAGRNCPSQLQEKFPLVATVDISIRSESHGHMLQKDISNRSLSPWDFKVDHDPERYPSDIVEAKCRHNWCLTSDGEKDLSLYSIPIRQEILVLRRFQRGCKHSFRLEKKMITVACTCVRPTIQYQE